MADKPKLLMHACCATCVLHPYTAAKKDYNISIYYYNPNISPKKEYEKRLEGMRTVSSKFSIPLIIGKYQKQKWDRAAAGLEDEPEGGKRCIACFKLRLFETAGMAARLGFDKFCTTLSVSPHKDVNALNLAGEQASAYFNIGFLKYDFKKKDGFQKTMIMSKQLALYRQNYCGCIYSRK